MNCGVKQSGRSDVRHLSDQSPNQTLLRDRDSATGVEGIESDCPKRAQRILNEAKNAKRKKKKVKHESCFFSIQGAAGQSEHHESVYQRSQERGDNRNPDRKDRGPTLRERK